MGTIKPLAFPNFLRTNWKPIALFTVFLGVVIFYACTKKPKNKKDTVVGKKSINKKGGNGFTQEKKPKKTSSVKQTNGKSNHSENKTAVNINAQDKNGLTELHRAVIAKNTVCFKSLLDAGANPNITNYACFNWGCSTPLYFAIVKNYVEIATLLIEHPATDIDKMNSKGETGLFVAFYVNPKDSEDRRAEIITLLKERRKRDLAKSEMEI